MARKIEYHISATVVSARGVFLIPPSCRIDLHALASRLTGQPVLDGKKVSRVLVYFHVEENGSHYKISAQIYASGGWVIWGAPSLEHVRRVLEILSKHVSEVIVCE